MKLIAEIGLNHFGSLEKASLLMRQAAHYGVPAVKFQFYNLEKFCNPSLKFYNLFKICTVPPSFIESTRNLATKLNLDWGASTFDKETTKFCLSLDPSFLKVASCEALNTELRELYINTDKLIIVSLGMQPIDKVAKLWGAGCYMHCVSEYPTKPEHAGLEEINNIKNYIIKNTKPHAKLSAVGYSDHTVGTLAMEIAAIRYGVNIIEKHVCLREDRENYELNCLTPDLLGAATLEELGGVEIKVSEARKYINEVEEKFDIKYSRENYNKKRGD